MAASSPSYQPLPNSEDENEMTVEPETTTVGIPENEPIINPPPPNDDPPPYDLGQLASVSTAQDFTESPPLYSDVVKLPTYNESENIESEEEEENVVQNRSVLFYLLPNEPNDELNNETIGTDIGFILCFFITFIFNGIGFIIAYCSTNTLSSHYGAISGFGLSLVKWSFVAKHSSYSKDYFHGNEWLLYILILLGWMIFLRGMFAYAQLKRYIYSTSRQRDVIE